MNAREKEKKHAHHEDTVLEFLRARGYRITIPRRAIIAALESAVAPKTVKEIATRTNVKEFSTIYRTLEELVKEKIASVYTNNGVTYYEIAKHHHDHAVCDECGKIEHIPCSVTKTPSVRGWKVSGHEIIWRGRCATCA